MKQTLDLETDQETAVLACNVKPHEDVEDLDDAYEADEMVDQAFEGEKIYIAANKADGRIMQHNLSGVLHFMGLDDKFVCGRNMNGFHGHVLDDLADEWPMPTVPKGNGRRGCQHLFGWLRFEGGCALELWTWPRAKRNMLLTIVACGHCDVHLIGFHEFSACKLQLSASTEHKFRLRLRHFCSATSSSFFSV